MSQGQFRAAPHSVVFDGQSLNNYPAAPNNYPTVLMASYTTVQRRNVAKDSTSITNLATTVATRLNPYAKGALTSILILCAGTSDIWDGDSGATLYSDHVTYGNNARTAGFDKVLACTLVGNSTNTGPQNTARADFNTLLLADASAAFDGKPDLAANANLSDWTNATYYDGGIHWTAAGAVVAAAVIDPVLAPFLTP